MRNLLPKPRQREDRRIEHESRRGARLRWRADDEKEADDVCPLHTLSRAKPFYVLPTNVKFSFFFFAMFANCDCDILFGRVTPEEERRLGEKQTETEKS